VDHNSPVHQPLSGVKMVEVAQFTFTPAAGAVLADWGADVIKVEHADSGDAQRGMRSQPADGCWFPVMEHPNRGKRSIGLALENPAAHEVLLELCRDADVFLTNFLPNARRRLHIEVEDIRAVNPNIIYVRGSAHGQRGPWAELGGFDGTSFWCRMGAGWGVTPADAERVVGMPAGAYGDSIGGMTIAGGIAAALLGRERTGEPSVVDVSLMSVGAWAFGLSLGNAAMTGENQPAPVLDGTLNPLANTFRTADGRWINFTMMQPFRFFADVCHHLGVEHLIDDPRFDSFEHLMANTLDASRCFTEAIAAKPYAYWVDRLQTMEGQWAPVQEPLDILADPQMEANGYLVGVTDLDGNQRTLIANPVQFDERPPVIVRAPEFAEHTDQLLSELGRSEDEIMKLKIEGAAT
jgi:crotonobetainyl-CoA:carnitine CoA-transferase CaiB-like acyl-CoA transferase